MTDAILLKAEATLNGDSVTAAVVAPDAAWSADTPTASIALTEYPVTFVVAFPSLEGDSDVLTLLADVPSFRRKVILALGRALDEFIANGFEVVR